jgi:hypothetical protein
MVWGTSVCTAFRRNLRYGARRFFGCFSRDIPPEGRTTNAIIIALFPSRDEIIKFIDSLESIGTTIEN